MVEANRFTTEYITLNYYPRAQFETQDLQDTFRIIEGYLQRIEGRIEVLQDAVTRLETQLTTVPATHHMHGSIEFLSSDGTWQDGITTFAVFRTIVPDGWQAVTDILFYVLRHATVATGTSRMTTNIYRFRDATPVLLMASADIDFTPGDTNSHVLTLLVNGGSLAAGDTISVYINRLGGDTADTHTGAVAADGFWFAYFGL